MRNAATVVVFAGAVISLIAYTGRIAPSAPQAVPAPQARATPTTSAAQTALPTGIPAGAAPMPFVVAKPSTTPAGPRGTFLSLVYGGDAQGEIEPCG